MREGKALFPFSLLRFSPPPLPSPSFFVPATQAKESVAAEIYNSCTIQYNSWVFLVYCTLFLLGLSCFRKCWFYSLFIHLFFNLNGFSSFTGI